MKDILFIGATHGDEAIGVDVAQELLVQSDNFDLVVGNPKAFDQTKRFTQQDLNRSAPGNLQSNIYESKRAAELIKLSQKYKYTIDLHGVKNDMGIFIIVTEPTKENLTLASMLDINRIVIWPSITPEMQYPLSKFFPCGLEIECGDKYNQKTYTKLKKILKKFLDEYENLDTNIEAVKKRLSQKQILTMYGDLKRKPGIELNKLKDFSPALIEDETFFPAFVSTYPYQDVICYKLHETKTEDLF